MPLRTPARGALQQATDAATERAALAEAVVGARGTPTSPTPGHRDGLLLGLDQAAQRLDDGLDALLEGLLHPGSQALLRFLGGGTLGLGGRDTFWQSSLMMRMPLRMSMAVQIFHHAAVRI